jgi:hypothetical protein
VKRATRISLVLLACASVLVLQGVFAQGRSPVPGTRKAREDDHEARAVQMAELDAWLRRLPGRYQVVVTPPLERGGYASCDLERGDRRTSAVCPISGDSPIPRQFPGAKSQYKGRAECRGVEPGPGVSCVLDMDEPASGLSAPGPRVILFGLDPDDPGIRLMEVERVTSATYTGRGSLKGDRVSFKLECVKEFLAPLPWSTCTRTEQVLARKDGKRIEILPDQQLTAVPGAGFIPFLAGMQIRFVRVTEARR